MSKDCILFLVLLGIIVILAVVSLCVGSVQIPVKAIYAILAGEVDGLDIKESWRFIVLESRIPQMVTALLSGSSLALSGLFLQTAFRNPLAGPDVFGINSGAALAVALVMLGMGGRFSLGDYSASGYIAILLAAFVGAMVVTGIIFFCSRIVRSNTVLLIVGIMTGYISNSVVTLLNFYASEEGIKSYMAWGMGSFGNATLEQVPLFAIVTIFILILSFAFSKPLNAWLLGERYAESLGFDIKHLRQILLIITGLLTAVVTSFCGPIAFIGLATPHIARILLVTENHIKLIPMTILLGAAIALLCHLCCYLPGRGELVPLNAVTPLVGAPVIIYVLLKHR